MDKSSWWPSTNSLQLNCLDTTGRVRFDDIAARRYQLVFEPGTLAMAEKPDESEGDSPKAPKNHPKDVEPMKKHEKTVKNLEIHM